MPFNGHTYPWEAPNNRGHVWKTGDDGDVDIMAYARDPHNGPECMNCGYCFCHHCEDGPTEDCSTADGGSEHG